MLSAPPDGHTVFIAAGSYLTITPATTANLPYDVDRDFTPLAFITEIPLVIGARAGTPFRTLPELIAYAKANPGKVNYAANTPGTFPNLATEYLAERAQIKLTFVPYKGSTAAMQDILGGRLDVAVEGVAAYAAAIKANQLVPLAVTSERRDPTLPDVPAVAETIPGYSAIGFYAALAHAKTPEAVAAQAERRSARSARAARDGQAFLRPGHVREAHDTRGSRGLHSQGTRDLGRRREAHRIRAALMRILFSIVFTLWIGGAAAQSFPSKPIRLIVPYPPGGGTDTAARPIAQKMTESIGQAVIVDNRPGASEIIGTEAVARAAPDGYTLLLTTNAFAINPSLQPKLPYDSARDFAPVSPLVTTPFMLVSSPRLQANSMAELVKLAKAQPGKLNFASLGSGTPHHLAMEWLKLLAGVDIVAVPLQGRRPGPHRRDGRRGRAHVHRPDGRTRTSQRREGACARRDDGEAHAGRSGGPDDRRGRLTRSTRRLPGTASSRRPERQHQ